jgi:AraC family transcriptional regulator
MNLINENRMEQKPETFTEYQQRIIAVLVYIDQHLEETLTLDDLARVACFSQFHFHRIFQAFIGEALYAYIKRLRLERAASNLKTSDLSITDIAFKSGYETPAAFAKAFRERFGVTPTGFRTRSGNGSGKKQFNTTEEMMKPEIRILDDTNLLFVRRMGNYKQAAEEAWKALMKHAFWRVIINPSTKFIGISRDDPRLTEESKLRYDACITVKANVKTKGEVGVQTLKGGKYAVFLHQGPYEKFQETYDLIFSEWLPRSGCKLRETLCFEMYLNKNPRRTKPENLRTEIFVPIE